MVERVAGQDNFVNAGFVNKVIERVLYLFFVAHRRIA